MDSRSKFSEIVTIFERVRPEIERGIAEMQPTERKKARQMWLELVEMVETRNADIRTFVDKLSRFNKQVYECRNRSRVLASAADMNVT
jgi:hypothetical protein